MIAANWHHPRRVAGALASWPATPRLPDARAAGIIQSNDRRAHLGGQIQILTILMALASDSEPPNTVKSRQRRTPAASIRCSR
jgi:hypothetical protein